jgi:hypothetical protein
MTVINISWYLCILFVIAVVVASAISVAPGGETWAQLLVGAQATFAVLFGTLAVVFKKLGLSDPKWLLRVFQLIAVVATVAVILVIGG